MTRLHLTRVATLVAATLTVITLINFPEAVPPGIRGLIAGAAIGITAAVYRETTRREIRAALDQPQEAP